MSGVDTGEVVSIPAPQPAAVAQAPGLAGVVQLGADAVTMDDVARVALNAGFVGEDLVRAVAVAYAESRNDPNAVGNNTDGSRDYGLWQINSVHSPPVPDIFDPAVNANYAYSIFAQRDYTWFPWYAFYNPYTGERRSDQFMPQARAAVQRLLGSGAVATPSVPGVAAAQVEEPTPTALALDGESCLASWMGEDLAGAPTASGDPFDPDAFTAAMYTVPLGSVWAVTNTTTGASVEVVVNDRGPDRSTGRCIDLSAAAFSTIAGPDQGTVEVTVAPA
ncbi:Rare lipoprotein A (plasmid) [Euzebya pacifica]|uniref:Rare lipoprotein A n=1 Tax=Euzebya pacifica TaxID=1608957 RepID=A0A346Y725_9ACTN|nr:RlpA-like double-psi beta-barrel domain-containing protein [Euzebya pacifica]AXV10272.1 Rare lipoprotein A [Euzebya pacifica]